MKKIIAIFLLIVYTSSAFGAVFNFHYCGAYLTKISVTGLTKHQGCSCNPSDIPMSCCKDKLMHEKGNDQNSSTYPCTVLHQTSLLPPSFTNAQRAEYFNLSYSNTVVANAKPQILLPIFLLNENLRV